MLSWEEKRIKEPFVVYQHSKFHPADVSSYLQLIWSPKGQVHILLNKTTFPQKYPHKPIFVGICVKFHTNSGSGEECTWKKTAAEYFEYTTKYYQNTINNFAI